MQSNAPEKNAGSSFMGSRVFLTDCLSFSFCLLVSGAILSRPMTGGALYLAFEGALLFAFLRKPGSAACKAVRWIGSALAAAVAGLALAMAYTAEWKSAAFWQMAGITLCAAARFALTDGILRSSQPQKMPGVIVAQALFLLLGGLLLFSCPLSRSDLWALLAEYAVCGLLECLPPCRADSPVPAGEADRADTEALRSVHSLKIYRWMVLTAAAASHAALIMIFTCIALGAKSPAMQMLLSLLCMYAVSAATGLFLNRPKAAEADPNLILPLGLAAWLCGLLLFLRFLGSSSYLGGFAALALYSAGQTICLHVLAGLLPDMRRAAAFALGHEPGEAVDAALERGVRLSTLAEQAAALAGLTLICVFTRGASSDLWLSFAPFLTLPALGLFCAFIVLFILFPLRNLHLQKLRRYAELQKEGVENKPLRDQLEPVVIQRSVKNYGIRAVECVLRPFFFQRVKGAESVQLDKDIPCVFVCNHGEILGPVVCTLFSPFPFRAWSAYEMLDRNAVIDRTMNGTFQNIRGGKRRLLQGLMEHIGAPFLTWLLQSEGCIAVFHDNPRKLMQSFRETITAMQAGDNILVFPENAATSADGRYVEEGVSEFFTGFTMIGQMYANKTGKCPLFVPMYTDKKKRLITFGVPTRYDADAPVNEEKERLCDYLRGEIMRLAGMEKEKK